MPQGRLLQAALLSAPALLRWAWRRRPIDWEHQAFLDHFPQYTYTYLGLYLPKYGAPSGDARRLPGLLARFEWFICEAETGAGVHRLTWLYRFHSKKRKDPDTVYAFPGAIPFILEAAAKELDESRANNRSIVFSGSDAWLSASFGASDAERSATLKKLMLYFGTISYMAKDVDVGPVRTIPIGLFELYLRQGVLETALAAIAAARLDDAAKPRHILAAWDRHQRVERATSEVYGKSRRKARDWARNVTAKAGALQVDLRSIAPQEYWPQLASYKFMLSPLGVGIQATKTIEALLVLTLPITERGPFPTHDDLVRLGFPIILVDDWSELAPRFLQAQWEALAPRLARFRRWCLTSEAYWQWMTGRLDHCS